MEQEFFRLREVNDTLFSVVAYIYFKAFALLAEKYRKQETGKMG